MSQADTVQIKPDFNPHLINETFVPDWWSFDVLHKRAIKCHPAVVQSDRFLACHKLWLAVLQFKQLQERTRTRFAYEYKVG